MMRELAARVEEWCEGYLAFMLAIAAMAKRGLYAESSSLERFAKSTGRGQVDTIITVVVVAAVGLIGLLVYSQVEGATTLDASVADDDPANATALENSTDALNDGFEDAMELLPVVLIVLVAALVIGVISRFRR